MYRKWVASAGLVTVLLVGVGLSSVALAEAGEQRLRAGLLYGVPTDDLTDGASQTELDGAAGFHVAYEYLVADGIGIEAAIGALSHDLTVSEPGFADIAGEIDLNTLTLNVNFHLTEGKPADFFLGPTVGYAFWGDMELDVFAQEFATDDDFIYGVNLGVDVPIGKSRWGFAGAVNYLFSEVSLQGGSDIGVDPIHLKAGFFYRF